MCETSVLEDVSIDRPQAVSDCCVLCTARAGCRVEFRSTPFMQAVLSVFEFCMQLPVTDGVTQLARHSM